MAGPSLSLEVLAWGGRAVPLQVTGLEFDAAYDCRRVVAPVGEAAGEPAAAGPGGACAWDAAVSAGVLAAFDAASVRVAEGLGLNGLMDVEVMVGRDGPKLLEIDARLPSQTPTAVYWSSGLNIVELLERTVRDAAPPAIDRTPRRACVYQHVRASRGMLDVLGEHVMGGAGPLRLVPGFFGADEALTDYAPGSRRVGGDADRHRLRRARGARAGGRSGRRAGAARGSAGRARRRPAEGRRERCPMTRLTETDVTALTRDLEAFESRLLEATGLGLRDLALRTVTDGDRCVQLHGARIAAVPMSSGDGVIPGFSACVVATLLHLGCDAWMTTQPDVRGIQAAVAQGATVLFLADDHRFVALNLTKACSVDDDPATADGYVTALETAAGGLEGRDVLLLGLGPVGRAAARRLASRGAKVLVVEPDQERVEAAREVGLAFETTDLAGGLARCDLIFDATPAADIIDVGRPARGDHRRRTRHAFGVHRGGAEGPRRAPHPRAARHRRRGHGGARASLTPLRHRAHAGAPHRRPARCTIASRGGSIGRISVGSKPT